MPAKKGTAFNPITLASYKPQEGGEDYTDMKSMTVPSQNKSVRQILKASRAGLPMSVGYRQGVYSDTEIPVVEELNDYKHNKDKLVKKIKEQEAEYKWRQEKKEKEEAEKAAAIAAKEQAQANADVGDNAPK